MSFVPYVVEQSAHGERSYDIFSRLHRRCWKGWAMAMRQHDAIRPKDRVDGRCSGKKEWTDE